MSARAYSGLQIIADRADDIIIEVRGYSGSTPLVTLLAGGSRYTFSFEIEGELEDFANRLSLVIHNFFSSQADNKSVPSDKCQGMSAEKTPALPDSGLAVVSHQR